MFKKLVLFLICTVSNIKASCTLGSLQPVANSPFSVLGTSAVAPTTAFSPLVSGNLFLAVPDSTNSQVSIFFINQTTGAPTAAGSPTSVTTPLFAVFSPLIGGNLFLAVGTGSNQVSLFTVNQTTGALLAVTGSPFTVGTTPQGAAFLASGSNLFLAVVNTNSNNVSVFSVNTSTGFLTAVPGSPFSTGINSVPIQIAFSPAVSGGIFAAVSNTFTNNIAVFSVNPSTGVFTTIGAFATGSTFPVGISFSPLVFNNLYLAVSNESGNSLSMFSVNQSTGGLTAVAGSPFSIGGSPYQLAFAPFNSQNIILGTVEHSSALAATFSMNGQSGVLTPINTVSSASGAFGFSFSPFVSQNLFAAAAGQSNLLYIYSVCYGQASTCTC